MTNHITPPSKSHRIFLFGIVGLLVLIVVVVGSAVSLFAAANSETSNADTVSLAAVPEIQAEGSPAEGANSVPALELATIEGGVIELPGEAGQSTVIYTIGYWCATCIPGTQTLARLQHDYADRNVRFVAVDISPDTSAERLQPFLQAVGENDLIWAMDNNSAFLYTYQVNALDVVMVLNLDGEEVYRAQLYTSDSELRSLLDSMTTPAETRSKASSAAIPVINTVSEADGISLPPRPDDTEQPLPFAPCCG